MKKAVPCCLIVTCLLTAVPNAQDRPAAKSDSATENQLIAHERALQAAVAKGDKSSFESLVLLNDGDWTTSTSDGFIPIKLVADGLEHFRLTKWDIINPRVTWLDPDSAIVLSAWTASGTFWDRPVSPLAVATTVWTKRNGKWLAVTHQETEVTRR
jgi:hypothetical protein